MVFRRPEDFEHHYVDLPDMKVHYVREGGGPPLVLWHGWPGFWWDWRYVIGPLSEHFDVIVPDFRGSGDSDKTDLTDVSKYSMNQIVEDQLAFLDALGIEKTYLIAHDYGSIVAHKFLRKYPHRIVKAAITDPITPKFAQMSGNYSEGDWFALFSQHDVSLDMISLNRESRRIFYKHFFDEWSSRRPLLSDEELEIVIDNYMKPGNVHGGVNYDRANLSSTCKPWTTLDEKMSGVPVTLLWGLDDPSVIPSGKSHIPDYYSNFSLELIENCGHFVMIERPDIIIDRVLKSFKE